MREINVLDLVPVVARLCIESNCHATSDLIKATEDSIQREESQSGRAALLQIRENQKIAARENLAMCQDTGLIVIFVELGQEVQLVGADLNSAMDEGVRRGYRDGYLRKSCVRDPLQRENTKNNTPAIVHIQIVPGDQIHLTVAPKGGGSENMSTVRMLAPAAGREGIVATVVEWVKQAGANPCPPTIVGVGIGGNFERVAYLAKKSLLREIGYPNPDPFYAEMEREILEKINNLGIGPQGFGGRITSFAVHIETAPCHMASLPLAINLNCHVARHLSVII